MICRNCEYCSQPGVTYAYCDIQDKVIELNQECEVKDELQENLRNRQKNRGQMERGDTYNSME